MQVQSILLEGKFIHWGRVPYRGYVHHLWRLNLLKAKGIIVEAKLLESEFPFTGGRFHLLGLRLFTRGWFNLLCWDYLLEVKFIYSGRDNLLEADFIYWGQYYLLEAAFICWAEINYWRLTIFLQAEFNYQSWLSELIILLGLSHFTDGSGSLFGDWIVVGLSSFAVWDIVPSCRGLSPSGSSYCAGGVPQIDILLPW